jgi:hypothetical protein
MGNFFLKVYDLLRNGFMNYRIKFITLYRMPYEVSKSPLKKTAPRCKEVLLLVVVAITFFLNK